MVSPSVLRAVDFLQSFIALSTWCSGEMTLIVDQLVFFCGFISLGYGCLDYEHAISVW